MRRAHAYTVWSVGLLVGFVLLNVVFPFVWISLPLNGRIVDASGGAPIVGAVVVASWTVKGLEGYPVRRLAVEEAVSDSNGRFHIAGWGPRFHFGDGRLGRSEPELRFLARGYEPLFVARFLGNRREFGVITTSPNPVLLRFTDLFALRAAETRSADYDRVMADFVSSLNMVISIPLCETWTLPETEAVLQLIDSDLAKDLPTHAAFALAPSRFQSTCE